MFCSVITGGIFSFISMPDLNNLRKFITTTVYMSGFLKMVLKNCTPELDFTELEGLL